MKKENNLIAYLPGIDTYLLTLEKKKARNKLNVFGKKDTYRSISALKDKKITFKGLYSDHSDFIMFTQMCDNTNDRDFGIYNTTMGTSLGVIAGTCGALFALPKVTSFRASHRDLPVRHLKESPEG